QTPEQEEALRQAIRAAQVVLLVVSAHTSTSQIVREHLRIADIYKRPVMRVWAAGEEQQSETVPLAAEQTLLIDAREERYGRALEEIMVSLEPERADVSLVESPLAAPAAAPRNPYKGLHAFTREDAGDFFGRETLIEELTERVKRWLTSAQPAGS